MPRNRSEKITPEHRNALEYRNALRDGIDEARLLGYTGAFNSFPSLLCPDMWRLIVLAEGRVPRRARLGGTWLAVLKNAGAYVIECQRTS